MKPTFSIIVPVYNGEKHIEQCIIKLLQQSYNNYEVIIINDGSIDKTEEIVKAYERKYEVLRLFSKKNEGVSVARNVGIKAAKGEYILFVDSDDTLNTNALDILANRIEQDNNDLLLFGFMVTGDNNRFNDTEVLNQLANDSYIDNHDVLKNIISTNNNIMGYIWRACYKKSMLSNNQIRFPAGIKISEDYMFLLWCVKASNSVGIINNELYVYNLNDTSMSTKYIPTLLFDMTFVNDWMKKQIIDENPDLYNGYVCSVCNTYLRFLQNEFRNPKTTFREKVKNVSIAKKNGNYKNFLLQGIKWPSKFTRKSYISIVLFALNLEFIYEILFTLKEKKNVR